MSKRKNSERPSKPNKRRRESLIAPNSQHPLDSQGLSQCFSNVTIDQYLSVPPQFAENIKEGICKEHLDPLIMKYSESAKGVVLAHTNLKLLGRDTTGTDETPMALLAIDSPVAFIWTRTDLLVWAPAKGDVLKGTVTLQNPGYISILILDTFNATVRRDDIPSDWTFQRFQDHEFDDQEDSSTRSLGQWLRTNGEPIDTDLIITVREFNVSGRTVLVEGSLLTISDLHPPTIKAARIEPEVIADESSKDFEDVYYTEEE